VSDFAAALDHAMSMVAPILAIWVPIALVIDAIAWTVGGVVLWRRRRSLTRRQVLGVVGTLAALVVVRVALSAWL
jgi:hypothetical protein